MTFTYRPAKRDRTPLIIGVAGPTKSGKTYSAHRLARGLAGGGAVAMLNAEGAKGHQYADEFDYLACDIDAPFSPERYTEALKAALAINPAVVIVDSVSHMHNGPGGMLEYHQAEKKRMGGSEQVNFTAWIKPKAAETDFIYTLLGANCHVILCFRAKDKIKIVTGQKPIELGLQPIASESIPFETIFTLMLPAGTKGVPDLAISQMRKPFDTLVPKGKPIDEDLGRALAAWSAGAQSSGRGSGDLIVPESGVDASAEASSRPEEFASEPQRRLIFARAREAGVDQDELRRILVDLTGQDSSAAIPREAVEAVLLAVEAAGVPL